MKEFIVNIDNGITLTAIIVFFSGLITMCIIGHIHEKEKKEAEKRKIMDEKQKRWKNTVHETEKFVKKLEDKEQNKDYEKPVFKELSDEEIEAIHEKGHITPAEQVKEWEDMGLCVPGDAIGSASWRCDKFHSCHDCLVDYAGSCDEYTSIIDIMKNSNFTLYGNPETKNEENGKNTEEDIKVVCK